MTDIIEKINMEPKGICGSSLVSAVHEFLKAGVIESNGRIKSAEEIGGPLSSRLKAEKGGNYIILY